MAYSVRVIEFGSVRVAEVFVATHDCISRKGANGCINVKKDKDGKPVAPPTWTVEELVTT